MINSIHIPQQLLDDLKQRLQDLNNLVKKSGQIDYTFDDYEKIFSNFGWFIPYDIAYSQAVNVVNKFESNELNIANKILIAHFKKELNKIKENLIKNYPERESVLSEGFKAHKRKMFYASTLLFISQVDGITENQILLGKNFKKFKNYNKEHSLVKIFDKENPLTVNYKKESHNSNYSSDLNRHGAFHGLSLDFGSELNSYKALSLLYFISDFRNKIDLKN